jgi:LysM repeat protein
MLSHKFYSLALALALILLPSAIQPAAASSSTRLWGTRPLLSYFALTASLEAPLRQGAQLSPAQFERTRQIALEEVAALQQLQQRSQMFIADPNLSLEQKRQAILRMGYNRQVERIVYLSDHSLHRALPRDAYARLIAWIERRWPLEVALHGAASNAQSNPALLMDRLFPFRMIKAPLKSPRTYNIYATRYDAKGRYTVALPDQCLKLTNGGLRTCADRGYVVGQTYSVFISYKKSLGVNVGESGPWNIDDNFWATLADPTPRRMFADLPLGMPEAQAAFYNGYNGGLDQYGRKVTAPFAIDLSFDVATDLGLPNKVNDWVNVSFMWTEGWNLGGSGSGASGEGTRAAQVIAAIQTATANPDGSIIHEVQQGQTLWAIATTYGVTVQRLRQLNGLTESDVIVPAQKLLVRPAGETPTISANATLTVTPVNETQAARRTEKAASKTAEPQAQAALHTAVAIHAPLTTVTPSDAALSTESQSSLIATSSRFDPLLLVFSALALVGFGLFIFGSLNRKRS